MKVFKDNNSVKLIRDLISVSPLELVLFLIGPTITFTLLYFLEALPLVFPPWAIIFLPIMLSLLLSGGLSARLSSIILAGFLLLHNTMISPFPVYGDALEPLTIGAIILAAGAVSEIGGYFRRRAIVASLYEESLNVYSMEQATVRLKELNEILRLTLLDWENMHDKQKLGKMLLFQSEIGNMATIVDGWRQMVVEQQRLMRAGNRVAWFN